MNSDSVSYYDLQSMRDDLQDQIRDLERRLERAIEDNRMSARDSFADVREGLIDLGIRISRLEGR